MAFERKWKHFFFQAMDIPYDPRKHECVVNPGRLKGAPEWYPEGCTPHPDNLGPMPVPMPDVAHVPQFAEIQVIPEQIAAPSPHASQKWEPPADDVTGELTGHELFGEPVCWFSEADLNPAIVSFLAKWLIEPHIQKALKAAEAHLRAFNMDEEEEDPPEVWEASVQLHTGEHLDGRSPIQILCNVGWFQTAWLRARRLFNPQATGSGIVWELHISAHNCGPCLSHFFVFRGSEVIEVTGAD